MAAVLLALGVGAAAAQSVALQGTLGNKALLIVDGSAPKALGAGDTHLGVKVLTVTGDRAVVEVDGKRQTLRVGDMPANVGGAAQQQGNKIVLTASSGGHFRTQGTINGKSIQFLVDTGATSIALGAADAERLGIDYRKGTVGQAATPNGVVRVWQVKLSSVRIGDVEVYEVDAVVVPTQMPFALLGNTFLSRFQMRRENDIMVLERRY